MVVIGVGDGASGCGWVVGCNGRWCWSWQWVAEVVRDERGGGGGGGGVMVLIGGGGDPGWVAVVVWMVVCCDVGRWLWSLVLMGGGVCSDV